MFGNVIIKITSAPLLSKNKENYCAKNNYQTEGKIFNSEIDKGINLTSLLSVDALESLYQIICTGKVK